MTDLEELAAAARDADARRLPSFLNRPLPPPMYPPPGYYPYSMVPPRGSNAASWVAAAVFIAFVGVGALIIVLVSALPGRSVDQVRTANDPPKVVDDRPPVSVSAVSLLDRYETNEVAADAEFKGRTLIVRGTVSRIGRDISHSPFLSFKGDHVSFRSVQCFFPVESEAALARLSPGQEVVVSGLCDGMFGTVALKDCQLMYSGIWPYQRGIN